MVAHINIILLYCIVLKMLVIFIKFYNMVVDIYVFVFLKQYLYSLVFLFYPLLHDYLMLMKH